MVRVRKRDGTVEEFLESKIINGAKRAGATAEQAGRVAKEVGENIAHRAEFTAEELSEMVVGGIKKVNRTAADEFVKFRDNKLRSKKS
jgi:transcriptional regulator NrdR family protein